MIIIETNLKKIPESCTKCKYSYTTKDGRFCGVIFRYGLNMPIPYEYVSSVNNYCYLKPSNCPLKESEEIK